MKKTDKKLEKIRKRIRYWKLGLYKAQIAEQEHAEQMRKLLLELRQAFSNEFQKAIAESKVEPFTETKLNNDHKTIFRSKANAFSESISYIDLKIEQLKQEYVK